MTATLADHLRSLPDDALATLVQLRPDLVVPIPGDLSTLAARAGSRMSIARALDGLDQFTLQILDAVRLTRDPADGRSRVDAVLTVAQGVAPAAVHAALDRLRTLLLVYGPDADLRVVAGVEEVCSPYPAGLGRPAGELDPLAAKLCADAARLRRTLLSAPPAARAVLDRLAAGPPVGTVAPGTLNAAPDGEAVPPVRWLVEHRLLVPVPNPNAPAGRGDTVELPREIGLLLRRDTPLGPLQPEPPAVAAEPREPKTVDSAGAGQAMEAVRQTEALLAALAAEPAPVLRSGGLGVRDLRRLSRTAGLDEQTTALLLEVAHAAWLIGELDLPGAVRGGPDQQVLPTGGYDVWRGQPLAQRWGQLAQAWLAMTRQPGLVGQRDERDRPISVLSAQVERVSAPAARVAVLGVLTDLAPGTAPTAEEVLAIVAWRAPRRSRDRETVHRQVLTEAAQLGLTGLGALTSYGRLVVAEATGPAATTDDPLGLRTGPEQEDSERSGAVQALDDLLPAPVDHFLVQADLSIVVPGPPEPLLAAELDLVAEPESAGGASVYRVTAESVRRALDVGYSAEDLHTLFRRRSRTPVPQALTYLVDDVARKHGGLRVGSAGAYLRSDDEALLAEVLTDRQLSSLSLRRIAPTVLTTPVPVGRLLDALREAGHLPVREDASGAAVLTRPKTRRAPLRPPVAARTADPLASAKLSAPQALGIVEQIRRGDAAARRARQMPAGLRPGRAGEAGLTSVQAHSQALAVLQQAVRDQALVWVGYVDAHGATTSRLVRPVSIGAGYLRAEDERTEMLHTFALHRITAAVLDQ